MMRPVMKSSLDGSAVTPFGERYLKAQAESLISFAQGSKIATGGFGYLNSEGQVDPTRPLEAWINCRMTQVFGLAELTGIAAGRAYVEHGVNALLDLFEDREHGGFYNSVDRTGGAINAEKLAYDHMFVLLAASTALKLGVPRAEILFNRIDHVIDEKFWDSHFQMMHNNWNQDFSVLDTYHGINCNMHAVEALVAAYEVTLDNKYRDRAFAICKRAVDQFAREKDWLLPEHFDAAWNIEAEYNRDHPADPFKPYGVTIGHLFEWSRLALQLKLIARDSEDLTWIDRGAGSLYEIAKKFGWAADDSDRIYLHHGLAEAAGRYGAHALGGSRSRNERLHTLALHGRRSLYG
jgi:mannose/cellobiose epimerase-like protein (N-acyl-D-glucosamine 2-epimerase family)